MKGHLDVFYTIRWFGQLGRVLGQVGDPKLDTEGLCSGT